MSLCKCHRIELLGNKQVTQLIIYLALVAICLTALFRPFWGAIAFYTVSLIKPHSIWPWQFDGIPIYESLVASTLIGVIGNTLKGKSRLDRLKNRHCLPLILILTTMFLSNIFSPFPDNQLSSLITETMFVNIVFFLLVSCIAIEDRHVNLLIGALVFTSLYYTYWANSAYFSQDWSQFAFGRLKGPKGTQYSDANVFSTLFVMGYPFLVILLLRANGLLRKIPYVVLLVFLIHAILLCASRGALLSLGIVTLLVVLFTNSKKIKFLLLAGVVLGVIWQGSAILNRASDTVQDDHALEEKPINPRITSWKIGLDLIIEHPFLGVGPGRFLSASRFYYPGKSPHVAHSTIIGISATFGILAGATFLFLLWQTYRALIASRGLDKRNSLRIRQEGIFMSGIGFFVCGVFLDLYIFEPLYLLLLVNQFNGDLINQELAEAN